MINAHALGRRYNATWALRECTFSIPDGATVALVGPNGAGKTTLLHLIAGLNRPTEGTIRVLDGDPASDLTTLGRIGLVAQNTPLYASFAVADMLRLGARMNPHWDSDLASQRIDALGIPARQKCGSLSGGQRAQVALAVALGKRPDVLLLDEPLASLDPLARTEFIESLLPAAAERRRTIILSSHLVTDLERFCTHLLLVADGHVQLSDRVERILAEHRLVEAGEVGGRPVVDDGGGRASGRTLVYDPSGDVETGRERPGDRPSVEDVVVAYLSRAASTRAARRAAERTS